MGPVVPITVHTAFIAAPETAYSKSSYTNFQWEFSRTSTQTFVDQPRNDYPDRNPIAETEWPLSAVAEPTVVMDSGIAAQSNFDWLRQHEYHW